MQRTSKASQDGRENKRNNSHWVSCKGHSDFTKSCRQRTRFQAKQSLREGKEPLPKDPKYREYYD